MAESAAPTIEQPRRIRLDWIPGIIFFPRKTFKEITSQSQAVWLVPILILTLTTVLSVLVAGPIKRDAALMQGPTYPENWEYMTPEQQAQFEQTFQNTQKPVFIYVFPALMAATKVWVGWLLAGAILHLLLTMFGGRGSAGGSMNIVAWAGLPFAIRDIVQIIAMLSNKALIAGQGISGFITGDSGFPVFLGSVAAAVDLYLIWHIILVFMGVRASNGITPGKAVLSVVLTVLVVISLWALITFLVSLLSGQSISGYMPFF